MKNNLLLLFIFSLFFVLPINAQSIMKPDNLKIDIDSGLKNKIYSSLDSLFVQIDVDKLDDRLIGAENKELTISMLKLLKGVENNKKDNIENFYQKRLINFYPIDSDTYSLSISYVGQKAGEIPSIRMNFNLVVENYNGKIKFTLPLKHLTKSWKSKDVGNVKYFFREEINLQRAKKFNSKNTLIAKKLGIKAEKFDFYMCENYQEILQLLGVEYDSEAIGQTRDGYGVVGGHIFSIMNNEDFSHDIFHYYSGKINERQNRNWITEEGIAYSWGNAYYTDKNGEMIEQKLLVKELKKYLKNNSDASLLELFLNDTKIFNHLAPEISFRSTISSIICDEVERTKGMDGVSKMINAGRRTKTAENYFRVIKELLSIDKSNFDERVMKLIKEYK